MKSHPPAWDFFNRINSNMRETMCETECVCFTDDQMADSVLIGYPEASRSAVSSKLDAIRKAKR